MPGTRTDIRALVNDILKCINNWNQEKLDNLENRSVVIIETHRTTRAVY